LPPHIYSYPVISPPLAVLHTLVLVALLLDRSCICPAGLGAYSATAYVSHCRAVAYLSMLSLPVPLLGSCSNCMLVYICCV
jgi:hypothetical protein